jgi:hypothetical protein
VIYILLALVSSPLLSHAEEKPNFIWLMTEDIAPHFMENGKI